MQNESIHGCVHFLLTDSLLPEIVELNLLGYMRGKVTIHLCNESIKMEQQITDSLRSF